MEFTLLGVDLRRERDIEQLRRVALAQEAQIHALVRTLQAKCAELAALKGNEKELQQTLAPHRAALEVAVAILLRAE